MTVKELAGAATVLLCLTASAAAQDTPSAPKSQPKLSEVFEKAKEAPAGAPKAFEFEMSGFSYHVSPNGNGRREGGPLVRPFNLRLEIGEEITRVYFAKYGNDLLLICEVSYGDGGRGFVARLEQPSMRASWKQRVPGYNIVAAREGESLYLAAMGFVGRLELRKGEYLWKHGGLNRAADGPPLFESFELPEVRGDTVSFREAGVTGRPAKTITVNRKTGKLIHIE
jgi:hypothetical protein